jgi:hypothetical protein
MMFLRATLKILSHNALESGILTLRRPRIGELRLCEMDNRRRIHGASFGTMARYEGNRVTQVFAAPHANINIAEIPKNNLADFVSATPSEGTALEMWSEVAALISCTAERMTPTTACPDSIDRMTVGPKREDMAITEV